MEELVQELDNGYPWKQPSYSSGPEGVEGARVRGGCAGRSDRMCPSPDLKRRNLPGWRSSGTSDTNVGFQRSSLSGEEGGREGWRDLSWERKRGRERGKEQLCMQMKLLGPRAR